MAIFACSFCSKTQHEVRRIIAGAGAFICNECVHLCVETMARDGHGSKKAQDWLKQHPQLAEERASRPRT